jgi:uncharacterized protein YbaA (DUF1428 family)
VSKYVDGFVLPVPKKKMKAYVKMAKHCSKVWRACGALDYFECVADDVKHGELTSFPRSVKLKKNEVVVFSYITYKSRKHRDLVLQKVFKHPSMQKTIKDTHKILDTKRMIYGGFKTIVKIEN